MHQSHVCRPVRNTRSSKSTTFVRLPSRADSYKNSFFSKNCCWLELAVRLCSFPVVCWCVPWRLVFWSGPATGLLLTSVCRDTPAVKGRDPWLESTEELKNVTIIIVFIIASIDWLQLPSPVWGWKLAHWKCWILSVRYNNIHIRAVVISKLSRGDTPEPTSGVTYNKFCISGFRLYYLNVKWSLVTFDAACMTS